MFTIISVVTILLYLIAACWLGVRIFRLGLAAEPFNIATGALALLTIAAHGLILYQHIITREGMNLGFYHAFSLMSWVVAVIIILIGSFRPMGNLAIIFFPLAALSLLLESTLPGAYIISDPASVGLRMHILLSVSAYGLLAIATVQSIILAFQERQLRERQAMKVMNILPPMQTMEAFLIQVLSIGFFLLSLSLATGLMFIHDIFEQHLSHKVVFSILAWLIFAVVLWGRWSRGWRGRKLIHWTLGGFISLLLAYFGSKLVLEIILNRV